MSVDIPQQVRELIGVKKTRRVLVTARDISRFAQAIGETSPLHFDEVYAAKSRYGTIVAPPLFCQTLTYDELPRDQIGADGSPAELNVPIPAQRAVGGSSEYSIRRLVRAGETITVTSQLKDVYAKQGKSSILYMVVVLTEFADATGQLVASETATYIKRP
ncbi:MAG TPA: MaoC family dehydratase N-terminal domain-containing protein [Steroidobacteraceae bacterium]|nr:MaoC family dehydratase N-terminal domain-containing protein [Steroidobacteraceae bacterium]